VKIHEKYISRCIQLGKNGLGTAAPNPMVGCVIVHNGSIIGEGFTSQFGGPHAEVNAINAVTNKELLKEAILYVTLEPCAHHGKTPPCADLILKFNIPKVVVGIADPNEQVSGRGIERLAAAGCEVIYPVLEKEVREHHKRFLTFQEKKRPYIILKWAESLDGYIAPTLEKRSVTAEPYWITNRFSRQKVHQWRTEEQAIMVGSATVLADNPKLTSRLWKGKSPIRIIIDKDLEITPEHHVLDDTIRTLIITQTKPTANACTKTKYEVVDFTQNLASQICSALYRNQIQSVLIEGGAQTLQTFIDADLWDEARVFTGTNNFCEGLAAPAISGDLQKTITIDDDVLKIIHHD
jgi:diaminohydroxyphosphoribosylaminopyrimidine deaminase/5-amino-6-(5-phosphoribosylamino)uracil reductase